MSGPLSVTLAGLAADGGEVALAALTASYALAAGVKETPVTLPASEVALPTSGRSPALFAGATVDNFVYQVTLAHPPAGVSPGPYIGILTYGNGTGAADAFGPAPSSTIGPGMAVGFLVEGSPTENWQAATGSVSATSLNFPPVPCPNVSTLPPFVIQCSLGAFTSAGFSLNSYQPITGATVPGIFTLPLNSLAGAFMTVDCSLTSICGPPNSIQVSVIPQTATVVEALTQQFAATVTGTTAGQSTGVTWSIEEGPAGGTITQMGVYTAPGTANTYHVIATSIAAPTQVGAATVTVVPAGITVSITTPPSCPVTVQPSGPQPFVATVNGVTGGASTAVTWSVTATYGGGSISSTGPDTATYTAPPTPGSYYVEATSVADPAASVECMVVVAAPVSITLTPQNSAVLPGGSEQFTATVTGTTPPQTADVTWSTTGGSFPAATCPSSASANGQTMCTYQAPSTLGAYQVVATSTADTSESVQALVTVTDYANLAGTWVGTDSISISGQTTDLGYAEYIIVPYGTTELETTLCNTASTLAMLVGATGTSFNMLAGPDDCGAESWLNGCDATDVTFTANSSGGISAGGTLTMTLNGTVTGCPTSGTTLFAITFTGCLADVPCSP